MAEFYRFFDSTLNDKRLYNADEFAEYFRQILTDGIFNGGTNLKVSATGEDMSVNIADGFGWIKGYLYKVVGGHSLQVEASNPSLSRIDRVVLRWDKREEARYIKAFVLKGEANAEPVAPALTRNDDVFELSLAQIYVEAGKSFLPTESVTDERLNTEVCGLVNSLVQADTTEIFNQFSNWYKTNIPEFEKEWELWFSKQQSEGFVLTSDIEEFKTEIRDVLAESKAEVETVIKEATVTNTLKVIKTGKDAEGIFTTVTYKRKADDTTYCVSTLSGGETPLYTTRTEQYYDVTGTSVIATHVYTLSYDEDGTLISEV